ncbi:MAG TPA: DUF5752 family protein [Candidatus Acidoferrales bacterium]|nr:DUF5752 family protein [Candidatus Acidoferrales bacterium]
MKQARRPFQFVDAFYLVVVGLDSAHTLRDFRKQLGEVSQLCIFCHTFHSLATHHYTSYSSDFAQWTMAACNENELAEQLGAIDVRAFVDLEDLRAALVRVVDGYLAAHSASGDRPAFEPFYFSETREVVLPVDRRASNLAEMSESLRHLSLHSLHYHFVNSRLRLHLGTNDFSYWIEHELGFPELAAQINLVDFYTNTLREVRAEIIDCITPWIGR